MKTTPEKFVAIEIDLTQVIFRLWSGRSNLRGLTRVVDGEIVEFNLGLVVPFTLGISISAEQYGGILRGSSSSSNIQFLVNDRTIDFIRDYKWKGKEFRVYEGRENDEFDDMELVYVGKINDLSYDFISNMATISPVDVSWDLNKPLIPYMYASVPGEFEIEVLDGVLDKVLSDSETWLSEVEATSPGIIFTGTLGGSGIVNFPNGFVGKVQVRNDSDSNLSLRLLSTGSAYLLAISDGEVLFSNGETLIVATGDPNEDIIQGLIGKSKSRLWGEVKLIEPTLENDNGEYRISVIGIDSVQSVSVGGVNWNKASGSNNQAGEWSVNASTGMLTLGSVTLGQEVKCNARAVGYNSLTTGELMNEIITEKGKEFDADNLSQLRSDAPQLIGFYRDTNPINTLDALDLIMHSIAGWWGFGFDGKIRAGVVDEPGSVSDSISLSEVEIQSFVLSNLLPPAWRVRVEFAPNFKPLQNPLAGVTDAERILLTASGLNTTPFQDVGIFTSNPLAIDVPIIKSLVLLEADAELIRNRVAAAWGIERRIYNLSYSGDDLPELYDTIEINFQNINGMFRVHAITRSIGGGFHSLVIWG